MSELSQQEEIMTNQSRRSSTVSSAPSLQQINYQNELARKAIHVTSIAIPIIYFYIPQKLAIALLIPLFLGFLLVDLLKMFAKPVADLYFKLLTPMLRPHERDRTKNGFNGATYVSLSALLVVALFPKMIAIAAFAILIVSDTAAALVGRKIGKTKIFSKSLEGSLAFLFFALIIVAYTPFLNWQVGLIIAISATLVELYPISIFGHTLDDNLTIPLISGAIGFICYLTFFPNELDLISMNHILLREFANLLN